MQGNATLPPDLASLVIFDFESEEPECGIERDDNLFENRRNNIESELHCGDGSKRQRI